MANKKDFNIKWKAYADELHGQYQYTRSEIKRMIMEKFPQANANTVSSYLNHAYIGKVNPGCVGTRGYICPDCGRDNGTCLNQVHRIDNILRTRKCQSCGYVWNTVEIDADMYKSLSGKVA